MARAGPSFVYFVRRADGEGPVKIGCTEYPIERLSTLTCWAPYPLAMVAHLPGDERIERRFHARFSGQHSHREWFHPSADLDAVIAAVAAGDFDISTLPDGKRLHPGNSAITHETRQRIGFTSALSRVFHDTGVKPPADVEEALERLEESSGDARGRDIALIRAHIADPLARGEIYAAPWCAAKRAEYLARKAA